MIKCQVNVCAVISHAASMKNSKDGTEFVSFGVTVPMKGRDGSSKNIDINVTTDGDKSKIYVYSTGRRVEITGTLYVRKKGGKIFLNLRAESVKFTSSESENLLAGSMEFTGKVGKRGIEEKTNKNGNAFKVFSAFSVDKDGENAEFIWVRFTCGASQAGIETVQPNNYVKVGGDMQMTLYKGEISLDCRVIKLEPWLLQKDK